MIDEIYIMKCLGKRKGGKKEKLKIYISLFVHMNITYRIRNSKEGQRGRRRFGKEISFQPLSKYNKIKK